MSLQFDQESRKNIIRKILFQNRKNLWCTLWKCSKLSGSSQRRKIKLAYMSVLNCHKIYRLVLEMRGVCFEHKALLALNLPGTIQVLSSAYIINSAVVLRNKSLT